MKVEITRYKSGEKAGTIKKKDIRIDYHDTWDIAYTLAPIIGAMVKQLLEVSHGYGAIERVDVPEELHSTYETESSAGTAFSKEAWDWVLQEVIWAMDEIASDKANEPAWHTKTGETTFSDPDPVTGTSTLSFEGWESTPESQAANKAYHSRIQRGCELFGKYMKTMWD